MKLTRKQWILILIGVLVIVLLWWMSKLRGTSGQGATSDTGEDTSEGDATLPDPTENASISAHGGSISFTPDGGATRGDRPHPVTSGTSTPSGPGVEGVVVHRKDVLI